jgi:hypothetical protein
MINQQDIADILVYRSDYIHNKMKPDEEEHGVVLAGRIAREVLRDEDG